MISIFSCATRKCNASSFSPGFLAAEIGRSNERMLRASIMDFRAANNLPGTDQDVLTEAECDALKHNNDAVYAFIGFKQVINPVNQLKMTFPAGLLPPEAKPTTESWQEYENPAVSRVGIDVFRVSGRESSDQLVHARLHVLQQSDPHLHSQLGLGDHRRRLR